MIKSNNKIIADSGYYLIDSKGNKNIIFQFDENEKYTEEIIPETFEKLCDNSYKIGGIFRINVIHWVNIKDVLVSSLFPIEDQIAIILNKNDNAESKKKFAVMQGWRKYFSQKIAEVKELIKKEKEENGEME